MNYRKARSILVIWFCLLANQNALAATRLISCRPDQENQRFICLDDAVAEVKPYIEKYIYVVGYGSAKRISCAGWRYAAAFKRQLLDEIAGQGVSVNESRVRAIDGGYREEALIEIYASDYDERPPSTAKWPPNCR